MTTALSTDAPRTLVLVGHPDPNSLCAAMAQRYVDAARDAGKPVRLLQLGQLAFDPVLRAGYRSSQPLEPDLRAAQDDILWAQHLVWVYPTWWGAMPALLKGFIDRIFLPGFAFKYRPNSSLWDRLLAGRSARLLVTMDAPPWYYRWFNRMPGHQQMRRTILEFAGVTPVRISSFGPVRGARPGLIDRWLQEAARLGRTD